jgi:hypothetical protein
MWGGSLYGRFEASAVFMVLLSLCNRDGEIDMTPEAIAGVTGWPLEFISKGLVELAAPDKRSRTHGHGGRRILPIDEHRDWGWKLTNYQKYRDEMRSLERREYLREAKRRERASTDVNTSTNVNRVQPIAEAEAEAEAEKKKDAASPLPPSLNIQAWEEWQAYRAERKLPKYRPTSVAKNSAFLASRSAEDQQAIVDYSIRNGYQGLFEAKVNSGGKPAKFVAPPDEEEAHA